MGTLEIGGFLASSLFPSFWCIWTCFRLRIQSSEHFVRLSASLCPQRPMISGPSEHRKGLGHLEGDCQFDST